jgi:hypothetical protein
MKKFIAAAIVGALPLLTLSSANAAFDYDANCDGIVSQEDVTIIRHHIVAIDTACHGDVDEDGDVDAIDALHVLRKLYCFRLFVSF